MFVQVTLYHVLASMHVTMSGSSIRDLLPGGVLWYCYPRLPLEVKQFEERCCQGLVPANVRRRIWLAPLFSMTLARVSLSASSFPSFPCYCTTTSGGLIVEDVIAIVASPLLYR